ncbi:MAG: DNA topoisomerase III, partial [Desulfocapsa sp.]
SRQYIAQFYPHFETIDKQIDTEIEGGIFIARQTDTLSDGWKSVLHPKQTTENKAKATTPIPKKLPSLTKGDSVFCSDAQLSEKKTTPPKHFTDATLLSAMTGIARYVSDPKIKKVLRETDGIGTEATRAGIIELLFQREYLQRQGREIHATMIGKQLITSLPESMGHPDMTAHWESQLDAISLRTISYARFMQPMIQDLRRLVDDVNQVDFQGLQGLGKINKSRDSKKRYKHKKRTTR